jgi:hypothetical protein
MLRSERSTQHVADAQLNILLDHAIGGPITAVLWRQAAVRFGGSKGSYASALPSL